jgi:DNA-directed RNA polymerase beta subunit
LARARSERISFAKIPEVLPLPDLLAVQHDSFQWFLERGLKEIFEEVSPIEDFTGTLKLELTDHRFEDPDPALSVEEKIEEAKEHDSNYSNPLFVTARFMNTQTGEIKEQQVFLGDFPMMTPNGTFIINGTERVVVSQLVRSPGVYFDLTADRTSDRDIASAKVIPGRGAWLEFDDIDHFGNRRIRSVGELIQNQVRIGLSRMERVVRERMTTQDVEAITPQTLINIRPVVAAIKEFFGTSQLSQFMDQTNPLPGLTHKRRLSALGPAACRVSAPASRSATSTRPLRPHVPDRDAGGPEHRPDRLARDLRPVNEFGFIETPYRKVVDGKVTDEIDYLTADEEESYVVAQAKRRCSRRQTATSACSFVAAGRVLVRPPQMLEAASSVTTDILRAARPRSTTWTSRRSRSCRSPRR